MKTLAVIALVLGVIGVTVAAQSSGDAQSAVLLTHVGDTSGSMSVYLERLKVAEEAQVRRLHSGDAFARIEFDADARVVALSRITATETVNDVLQVLESRRPEGRRTQISSGLIKAREIAESHPLDQIVLVLLTDAKEAPSDSLEAEAQRMKDVTAWWRGRANAQRILVAATPQIELQPEFVALAKDLDARVISLRQFSDEDTAVRVVEDAHGISRAPVAPPPTPLPQRSVLLQLGGAALALGLPIVGLVVWRSRHAQDHSSSAAEPLAKTARGVLLRVTADGVSKEHSVTLRDDADGDSITIGGSGAVVQIPGYAGPPIRIEASLDRSTVVVPPGLNAWVGASRVPTAGGTFRFLQKTAIRIRGAYVSISIDRLSNREGEAAHVPAAGL